MSSTHSGGSGNYAVDGIRGGLWDQGCASTNREKNPWMLIDLGGDYMVSEVYLRNRNDCCGKSDSSSIGRHSVPHCEWRPE